MPGPMSGGGAACEGGVCGAALPWWWRGGWGFVGSAERSSRPPFFWQAGVSCWC
nr:MAG TPA: hypothetical protein [Caudoviricetes sp.]